MLRREGGIKQSSASKEIHNSTYKLNADGEERDQTAFSVKGGAWQHSQAEH
jgi:hypothetical protein